MKKYILGLVLASVVFISACDDPDTTEPPKLPAAPVSVSFDHVFGGENLVLNDDYYVAASGDSIMPTKLIYHVNNFEFETADGEVVKPATTYFMVNEDDVDSKILDMGELEDKTFTKMRFTLGVADSTISADGGLNGLFLDPLYWNMIAGYINFKLEGKSPSSPSGSIFYHLGGYQGDYKINHAYEVDFTEKQVKSEIGRNKISLRLNIAKLLSDPNEIDMSVYYDVQLPNDQAKAMAENFPGMITLIGVQ